MAHLTRESMGECRESISATAIQVADYRYNEWRAWTDQLAREHALVACLGPLAHSLPLVRRKKSEDEGSWVELYHLHQDRP